MANENIVNLPHIWKTNFGEDNDVIVIAEVVPGDVR